MSIYRPLSFTLKFLNICQNNNVIKQFEIIKVIVLVGYFTANHADNQTIVQEGSQPSVLQQLANLPFQYFSQTELKEHHHLFIFPKPICNRLIRTGSQPYWKIF